MPTVEIRLLGAPTVSWDAVPQAILRRQTRNLLYRLAVPGPQLTRAYLCFLFWPDVPESTAARNLSHLLTHLKQALPDADTLVAADERVWLDPANIRSDVDAFLRLRRLRRGCGDTKLLERAVRLYRGPFLDSVCAPHNANYESWLLLERGTLERDYRDTLQTLMDHFYRCGECDQVIRYANRYLMTDPLDEAVHQRLIAMYAERGDRAAALRQYRQCEELLQSELGVQPLPETKALFDALRTRRPAQGDVPRPAHGWTTLPGPRLPMVGRDSEWRVLQNGFARAAERRGTVVLITGEAGAGKTRLLEEFVGRMPVRSLVAAGLPGAERISFRVLLQAIRSVLDASGVSCDIRAELGGLSPIWLKEAARLLPELAAGEGSVSRPLTPQRRDEHGTPQLYEAISRVVLALTAGSRPGLLCLDNLQWADCETLEWIAYFATQLQRTSLLVLLACRRLDDRLSGLCRGLSRQDMLVEIKLSGLRRSDISQLLHFALDDAEKEADLVDRVFDASAGNPFCAIQHAVSLVQSSLSAEEWTSLAELPVPTDLCTAVHERLDALEPVTRQVIDACAVLAPVFSFDLVRLTCGRREMETLDALENLVARGYLECNGVDYRFHQEVILSVLQMGMSPVRRRLLQRRAGRALAEAGAVCLLERNEEVRGHAVDWSRERTAAHRFDPYLALQEPEDVLTHHSAVRPQ